MASLMDYQMGNGSGGGSYVGGVPGGGGPSVPWNSPAGPYGPNGGIGPVGPVGGGGAPPIPGGGGVPLSGYGGPIDFPGGTGPGGGGFNLQDFLNNFGTPDFSGGPGGYGRSNVRWDNVNFNDVNFNPATASLMSGDYSAAYPTEISGVALGQGDRVRDYMNSNANTAQGAALAGGAYGNTAAAQAAGAANMAAAGREAAMAADQIYARDLAQQLSNNQFNASQLFGKDQFNASAKNNTSQFNALQDLNAQLANSQGNYQADYANSQGNYNADTFNQNLNFQAGTNAANNALSAYLAQLGIGGQLALGDQAYQNQRGLGYDQYLYGQSNMEQASMLRRAEADQQFQQDRWMFGEQAALEKWKQREAQQHESGMQGAEYEQRRWEQEMQDKLARDQLDQNQQNFLLELMRSLGFQVDYSNSDTLGSLYDLLMGRLGGGLGGMRGGGLGGQRWG